MQRALPPTVASLDLLELPPAVRDVIDQRIAALSDESRRVLSAAAAAGPEFDAYVLADALGLALERLLAALEPSWRLGLLQPRAHLHRYGFAHALVQEALYAQLSLAERGALHGKLAHALSARSAGSDARRLAEVAHHFLRAVPSELDLCLQHCRLAADAARHTSGFDAAIDLTSRALQKLTSEGGDERTRCDLLGSLGMDQLFAGDVTAAWHSLVAGAEIARQLADASRLSDLAFRLAHCVDLGGGDEEHLRTTLEEAIRLAGDGDTGTRAVLLAIRAKTGIDLPGRERAALLDRADQLARQDATPEQHIELRWCRAMLGCPDRLDDSRRAAHELRALMKLHPYAASRAPYSRAIPQFAAEFCEYICALTEGDLEAADEAAASCRACAERSQLVSLMILAELMQAGRALGDGRLDDLEQSVNGLCAASTQLHQAASGAGMIVWAWQGYQMRLAEARGLLAALGPIDPAYFAALQQFSPRQRAYATIWQSWRLAKLGKHDLARSSLAQIPALELSRMPSQFGDLGALCMLADTHWELAEHKSAQLLHERLAPHAERNAVGIAFDSWGSVSHYLGLLATLLGRDAEARERFSRAEVINTRLRMPVQLARTRAALERARSAMK